MLALLPVVNLMNSGGLDATVVVLNVKKVLVFMSGPKCLRFVKLNDTNTNFVTIFLTTRDCHLRHLTV